MARTTTYTNTLGDSPGRRYNTEGLAGEGPSHSRRSHMKYVKAAWDDELQGFHTDATAYLAALPELEAR
ncbi:hypothetical protein ACFVYD_03255 [Streptomyces sp. NPDC058301]|uniref:hypothetical protein n=1 Tax=Streptomyces sp. NPDC058301 TaxID=3346436 RepID=UPI0036E84FD9